MNYRLSCYADRRVNKLCILLESEGKIIEKEVVKTSNTNLKVCMLESIHKGIKIARNLVKHKDLLIIEAQNNHLVEWLNGRSEYKGYEEFLDLVYSELESVDCRYRFVYNDMKVAKKVLNECDVKKETLQGISSLGQLEIQVG